MESNKKKLTTQTFTITIVDRFNVTEGKMLGLLTTGNYLFDQKDDEFIEVTKKGKLLNGNDLALKLKDVLMDKSEEFINEKTSCSKADEEIVLDLAADYSACISSGNKTISFSSEDFKEFVLGLEPLFLTLKDK